MPIKLWINRERPRQRRLDIAGRKAVRLNVVLRPLHRHGTRQHLQAAFCRRVVSDCGPRDLGVQRAQINDLPSPAPDHARHHGTRDEKRAGQVHIQDRLPVLQRHAFERRATMNAGIVDQHIERTDRRLDFRHATPDVRLLSDVETPPIHHKTFASQGRDRRLEPQRINVIQNQFSSRRSQPPRKGETDSLSRSRHQHAPAL